MEAVENPLPESGEELQEAYFGHRHLTVIEPPKGWRMLDLKELWAYRELFWVLTARDINTVAEAYCR